MPLSVDHVFAIENHFAGRCRRSGWRSRLDSGSVELRLAGDQLRIISVDEADAPVGPGGLELWVGQALPVDCDAVGLCVSVGDRLFVGAIVDRDGSADWFTVDDGLLIFGGSDSYQLLDDLCRRRLGLATAPPGRGTDWYWLHEWLTDVASATWPELGLVEPVAPLLDVVTVASWHPAVDVEELAGLDRAGITSFVVGRHRDHCAAADWSCVRSDALADAGHWGHAWARQLDDGAFSRWMSGGGAPLVALAEPLIAGCSPLALELLGAVVSDVVVRNAVG